MLIIIKDSVLSPYFRVLLNLLCIALTPCKASLTGNDLLSCSITQLRRSKEASGIRDSIFVGCVRKVLKTLLSCKLHAIRLSARLKLKAFSKNKIRLVWCR